MAVWVLPVNTQEGLLQCYQQFTAQFGSKSSLNVAVLWGMEKDGAFHVGCVVPSHPTEPLELACEVAGVQRTGQLRWWGRAFTIAPWCWAMHCVHSLTSVSRNSILLTFAFWLKSRPPARVQSQTHRLPRDCVKQSGQRHGAGQQSWEVEVTLLRVIYRWLVDIHTLCNLLYVQRRFERYYCAYSVLQKYR